MRRWFVLSLVVTLAALTASLYVSFVRPDLLPEKVPIHWNIRGEADGWVPRDEAWKALFLMPGVMVLLNVLTLVLPWLSPKRFNPERFRATYDFIMAMVVILMGYLNTMILLASMEAPMDIGRWFASGFFLFFAVIGNVMGKVRRNFYVGVRTPWTIASEVVWNRTHRFAAWLWVVAGVVGFVCAIAGVPLIVCFSGLMVAALTPVVYSLILYKRLEKTGQLKEEGQEASDPAT